MARRRSYRKKIYIIKKKSRRRARRISIRRARSARNGLHL